MLREVIGWDDSITIVTDSIDSGKSFEIYYDKSTEKFMSREYEYSNLFGGVEDWEHDPYEHNYLNEYELDAEKFLAYMLVCPTRFSKESIEFVANKLGIDISNYQANNDLIRKAVCEVVNNRYSASKFLMKRLDVESAGKLFYK